MPLMDSLVDVLKDDSSDHIIFYRPVLLNSYMCIHLCNDWFMHCTPTITSISIISNITL